MTAKKPGKTAKAARRLASKASRGKLITLPVKKAKRKTRPKIAHKHPRPPPAALEVQLRKTVAELGLTEARKIFASVEAAFGEPCETPIC